MENPKSFFRLKFQYWTRDFTSLANPLILIFIPFIVLGPSTVFFKLLAALLVNEVFCSLIKLFFPKKRPIVQAHNSLLEKIDAGSFPSIHTSRITLSFLTLFALSQSVEVKVVLILAIIIVMISRVLLKKHFWIDVLGGFFIGLIGFFILYQFLEPL